MYRQTLVQHIFLRTCHASSAERMNHIFKNPVFISPAHACAQTQTMGAYFLSNSFHSNKIKYTMKGNGIKSSFETVFLLMHYWYYHTLLTLKHTPMSYSTHSSITICSIVPEVVQTSMCSCCHTTARFSFCLCLEDPRRRRGYLSCFCSCKHHSLCRPVNTSINNTNINHLISNVDMYTPT